MSGGVFLYRKMFSPRKNEEITFARYEAKH